MTDRSTFARRVRAAKPRAKKYEVRDDVVSGLALTIQPTGVRTFFVSRMVRGRRRYATIGSADAMTIPEARREARRLIASYIEPAKTDSGPRTPGHPMDTFAGEFLERYARHWKPRTLTANAYVVRNHILPRLRAYDGGRHHRRARQGLGSRPWPTSPAAPTAPWPPCRS